MTTATGTGPTPVDSTKGGTAHKPSQVPPRRRPAPKLVEHFNMRVAEGQLDVWDAAARAEGRTLAEYVRLVVGPRG